jgi:hypothetical protein
MWENKIGSSELESELEIPFTIEAIKKLPADRLLRNSDSFFCRREIEYTQLDQFTLLGLAGKHQLGFVCPATKSNEGDLCNKIGIHVKN